MRAFELAPRRSFSVRDARFPSPDGTGIRSYGRTRWPWRTSLRGPGAWLPQDTKRSPPNRGSGGKPTGSCTERGGGTASQKRTSRFTWPELLRTHVSVAVLFDSQ